MRSPCVSFKITDTTNVIFLLLTNGIICDILYMTERAAVGMDFLSPGVVKTSVFLFSSISFLEIAF